MAVVDSNRVDGRVVGFHLANQRASFDRPEKINFNFTFYLQFSGIKYPDMPRFQMVKNKSVMECSYN